MLFFRPKKYNIIYICDYCMKVCMIDFYCFLFVYLSGEGGGRFGAGENFHFFFLFCFELSYGTSGPKFYIYECS